MKAIPESRHTPAITTRRPPCGFRMRCPSEPDMVAESVAVGKVPGKYLLKQYQQISWTAGVSASAFEIGNDPALTVKTASASHDIGFGLAQMR